MRFVRTVATVLLRSGVVESDSRYSDRSKSSPVGNRNSRPSYVRAIGDIAWESRIQLLCEQSIRNGDTRRLVAYKVRFSVRPMAKGNSFSCAISVYIVVMFLSLEFSGCGIINTALDGPATAMMASKVGTAMLISAFHQPEYARDVNKETKSSDQRYESCVACAMPDNAPNGTNPRMASERTMQNTTSTNETCIRSLWNLATNCRIVDSGGDKPMKNCVHWKSSGTNAPLNGIRWKRVCRAAMRRLRHIGTLRRSAETLNGDDNAGLSMHSCSRSWRIQLRNFEPRSFEGSLILSPSAGLRRAALTPRRLPISEVVRSIVDATYGSSVILRAGSAL